MLECIVSGLKFAHLIKPVQNNIYQEVSSVVRTAFYLLLTCFLMLLVTSSQCCKCKKMKQVTCLGMWRTLSFLHKNIKNINLMIVLWCFYSRHYYILQHIWLKKKKNWQKGNSSATLAGGQKAFSYSGLKTLENSVSSIKLGCSNGVMHEQCGGREGGREEGREGGGTHADGRIVCLDLSHTFLTRSSLPLSRNTLH